jgi:CelD/BcsL family acetyltransferase involved in cellulose biosynthesis
MDSTRGLRAAARHVRPLRWRISTAPAKPSVTVVDDLGEIEDLWRGFELDAITTPFQNFDWIAAYATTVATVEGHRTCALLGRDPDGDLNFILPLEIGTRLGARIAAVPGGAHANVQMPLLSVSGSRLSPRVLRRSLVATARDMGTVDAFHFRAQPRAWAGHPNPLPATALPTGERLHRLALDRDPATTLDRVIGKASRKKLRQKRRRLESLGKVAYHAASTAGESDAILAAFFEQKAERLREQHIPNPFVGATRDFLHRAVRAADNGHVALDLHALTLDSRIVAVFGATSDARSACGMFNSFARAPELLRISVGNLLLVEVIRHYARTGRRHFDLGVGEAEYKDTFCEEADPVVETILPVTSRGIAYAAVASAALTAKRVIKRSPLLLGALRRWGPAPSYGALGQ